MNENDPYFQMGLNFKQAGDCLSAQKFWLMAVEKGNINALHSLGLLFFEGKGGIKQDYKKAIYYWEVAAGKRHPKSLAQLGLMYSEGKDVKQDLIKAANYFEQALQIGFTDDQDSKKAFGYLKQIKQKLVFNKYNP